MGRIKTDMILYYACHSCDGGASSTPPSQNTPALLVCHTLDISLGNRYLTVILAKAGGAF